MTYDISDRISATHNANAIKKTEDSNLIPSDFTARHL